MARLTDGFQASALYDYSPTDEDELSFKCDDILYLVLSEEEGWCTGYIEKNPDTVGLVPMNYIQKIEKRKPNSEYISEYYSESSIIPESSRESSASDDSRSTTPNEKKDGKQLHVPPLVLPKELGYDSDEQSGRDTATGHRSVSPLSDYGPRMDSGSARTERDDSLDDEESLNAEIMQVQQETTNRDEEDELPRSPSVEMSLNNQESSSDLRRSSDSNLDSNLKKRTSVMEMKKAIKEAEEARQKAEEARKKAEADLLAQRSARKKAEGEAQRLRDEQELSRKEVELMDAEKEKEAQRLRDEQDAARKELEMIALEKDREVERLRNQHEEDVKEQACIAAAKKKEENLRKIKEEKERIRLQTEEKKVRDLRRRQEEKDRLYDIERENEQRKAALKIQCSTRQRLARQRVAQRKSQIQEHKAALCIQRHARGSMARKLAQQQQAAALKIQSAARRKMAYKTVARRRDILRERPVIAARMKIDTTLTPHMRTFIAQAVRDQTSEMFIQQDQMVAHMQTSMEVLIAKITSQTKELNALQSGIEPRPPAGHYPGPSSPRGRTRFPAVKGATHTTTTNSKPGSLSPKKLQKSSSGTITAVTLPLLESGSTTPRHGLVKETNVVGTLFPPCPTPLYSPTVFDENEETTNNTPPSSTLSLEYIHGYSGRIPSRSGLPRSCNLVYCAESREVIYPASCIIVCHLIESNTQRFYSQHTSKIDCLIAHPKKSLMASSSEPIKMGARSNIHVWDVGVESSSQTLPKAATLQTLEVPTSGSVASLAFSSDGEFLAAAGTDEQHTISIWHWSTAQLLVSVKGSSKSIYSLHFHPQVVQCHRTSCMFYALASCGSTHVKFWNFSQVGQRTEGHDKEWTLNAMPLTKSASRSISTLHDFTCLQFVPHPDRNDDEEMDEELAGIWLSGTSYGDIYLFAQRVGRPASQGVNNEVELISILSAAHHTSLIGLAYHANSDMIASCSEDGVIKFWPSRVLFPQDSSEAVLSTPRQMKLQESSSSSPRCFTWMGRSQMIIGWTHNSISIIEDIKSGTSLPLIRGHAGVVEVMAVHPTRNWFLTIGSERMLYLWDAITSSLIGQSTLENLSSCLAIHPKGQLVAVGFRNGQLLLIQMETVILPHHAWATVAQTKLTLDDVPVTGTLATFSPCGEYLAVVVRDCILVLAVHQNLVRISCCQGNGSPLTHLDWSCRKFFLQVNDMEKALYYYNGMNGKRVSGKEMRNRGWATWTCLYGWPVRGIVHTELCPTSIVRSHDEKTVILGTKNATLALYRYPIALEATGRETTLTTGAQRVHFLADDSVVMSFGRQEAVVFQWHHIQRRPSAAEQTSTRLRHNSTIS